LNPRALKTQEGTVAETSQANFTAVQAESVLFGEVPKSHKAALALTRTIGPQKHRQPYTAQEGDAADSQNQPKVVKRRPF